MLLLWCLTAPVLGIPVGPQREPIALASHYSVLEDPTAMLTYGEVSTATHRFHSPRLGEAPNFGYSSSAYWLRVTLKHTGEGAPHWLLEIPFPSLDDVRVYLRSQRDGRLVAQYHVGDHQPFSARPIDDVHFVFPLPLAPDEEYELFVRLRSDGLLAVGASLWPEDVFYAHSDTHHLKVGVYVGIVVGLLFYHLLLFLSLRDHVYLLYAAMAASFLIAQASWDGFTYAYLWPDSPGWANIAALAGLNASGLFSALFSRSFLQTRARAPHLDAALLVCAAAFTGLLGSLALVPYHALAVSTSLALLTFSLLTVFSGILCLQRKLASVRYFLFAWILLLTSAALLMARSAELIASDIAAQYAIQLASTLALLLLAFALAERNSTARAEKESAEAASRAKDEFLATVSHELRTPMTVLLGNVELLLGSGLQPRQSTLARSAKRSGEQLLSLLNDLIDLSRIATRQLHLEQRPFEAGALVREVAELMEVPAQDKGLSLKVHLGFKHIYVRSDPGRIRQVLLNLVFNAIKFTECGEILIEAAVLENAAGCATLRFAVNDTGIGIHPTDQERLFRPFSQVQGHHAQGGSGLGLAISRRLVEAMGGTIRLFSRPGQGSRFWFDLDLPLVSAEEMTSADPEVLPHSPTLRMLLVEDVHESREVLTAQLHQAGHRVTAVESGPAALAAFAPQAFDVVLMDLQMPGMDGYETVQRLRGLPGGREIPVFALTANVTTRTRAACLDAGMQEVVAKPLHMSELNATLHKFFGGKQRTDTASRAAGHGNPLLDEAMLAERLSDLGKEATGKIMRVFVAAAEQRLAAILQAHRAVDSQALASAAHLLRGSAGAVGLVALMELSGAIEEAASVPPSATDLVERLPQVLRSSAAALREWCTAREIELVDPAVKDVPEPH